MQKSRLIALRRIFIRCALACIILLTLVLSGVGAYTVFGPNNKAAGVTYTPDQYFPSLAASAQATRCLVPYFGYNQANTGLDAESRRLSPCRFQARETPRAWNGKGVMQALQVETSYILPVNENFGVVTKLVHLADDRWLTVGLPIYINNGLVTAYDLPGLVSGLSAEPVPVADQRELGQTPPETMRLADFFQQYFGNEQARLDRYLLNKGSLQVLNGSLEFERLESASASEGDNSKLVRADVWVRVTPNDPENSASLLFSYYLTMELRAGEWELDRLYIGRTPLQRGGSR